MKSTEESLRKAFLPAQLALKYHPEATAVAEKAIEQGVARIKRSREELYASARSITKRAREQAKYLMRSGFIQDFPT